MDLARGLEEEEEEEGVAAAERERQAAAAAAALAVVAEEEEEEEEEGAPRHRRTRTRVAATPLPNKKSSCLASNAPRRGARRHATYGLHPWGRTTYCLHTCTRAPRHHIRTREPALTQPDSISLSPPMSDCC